MWNCCYINRLCLIKKKHFYKITKELSVKQTYAESQDSTKQSYTKSQQDTTKQSYAESQDSTKQSYTESQDSTKQSYAESQDSTKQSYAKSQDSTKQSYAESQDSIGICLPNMTLSPNRHVGPVQVVAAEVLNWYPQYESAVVKQL